MSKVHYSMKWDCDWEPNAQGQTHKQFLAEKYDVEGNPRLDYCYQLAWDYGHANGYDEVENYFSDLVWLISDYEGGADDEYPDYGDDEA